MSRNSSVYSGYVYDVPKINWTNREELKSKLTYVTFDGKQKMPAGGLPVISDGKTGYIDASDNHCVIYGNSGAKKSTCVYMPAICIHANAGENFVVNDPKGELYRRTSGYVKAQGYRIITVNFRDYNGDAYNPLYYPAKLWQKGEVDKAASLVNDFCSVLAADQELNSQVDQFWPRTAKEELNGVISLMLDSYKNIEDINLLSLADYFTDSAVYLLREYLSKKKATNTALANLKAVHSEPDRTLMSTLATCSSFIQPFIQNDKLLRMLSYNTFELDDLTKEKTALYIITDDTTTVCNPIVGILISQLQTALVDKAFHSEDGKLPIRVNFLLDEFCSYPIPGICEALATHRSRNIRYYLCVQALDALFAKYPNYESLLANCATSLFLGSTEMKLLDNISKRCGETERTINGEKRPLISVAELMTLHKSWDYKEAIYLNLSEAIRYCTMLPAIEQYEIFNKFGESRLPNRVYPEVSVYTFSDLLHDISNGKAVEPFTPRTPKKVHRKRLLDEYEKKCESCTSRQEKTSDALDAIFSQLFDSEEE